MDKFVELPNQKFKRIFTVEELERLFAAEILSDDESVELTEGEILQRRETISDEVREAEKIAENLKQLFGDKAVVKIQPLINLAETQCLKPSVAVIRPSLTGKRNLIDATDTFFVIELTDLRFNYADNPRGRYYGLFNYPEVWFVNLSLGLIEVCTKPSYGFSQCRTYLRDSIVECESSPDLSLNSNKLLG